MSSLMISMAIKWLVIVDEFWAETDFARFPQFLQHLGVQNFPTSFLMGIAIINHHMNRDGDEM